MTQWHRYGLLATLALVNAHAQTLSLSGPTAAKQGTTETIQLNLAGSTATGPAGLQWTLVAPSGVTVSAAMAGTASKMPKRITSAATNALAPRKTTFSGTDGIWLASM